MAPRDDRFKRLERRPVYSDSPASGERWTLPLQIRCRNVRYCPRASPSLHATAARMRSWNLWAWRLDKGLS